MQPNSQPQPKNLSEIVKEYADDILPGELMDVLAAIKVLKAGSGWGKIELKYMNGDLNDIDIGITRKRTRAK